MDDVDAMTDSLLRLRALKEALKLFLNGDGDVPTLEEGVRDTAAAYFLELMDANFNALERTVVVACERDDRIDEKCAATRVRARVERAQ